MAYGRYQRGGSTPILIIIGINIILFIFIWINPEIIRSLGLAQAYFVERPWTIVTNMFIHSSFGHILANMLTLFFFGRYLSALVGEKKFLLIYFIGGLVGNMFWLLLAPSPFHVGVGASGAVFAVGGALAVMRPKLRVFVFPIPAPIPLWVAVLGGFVIISLFPNIAWQAHLGGLLLGLIAGYVLKSRERYTVL